MDKISKTLNENDINLVIDEVVNDEDFSKSESEMETCQKIEELKYPEEYEEGV